MLRSRSQPHVCDAGALLPHEDEDRKKVASFLSFSLSLLPSSQLLAARCLCAAPDVQHGANRLREA
eukprot:1259565-Rhodomonas_salina.2